MLIIILMFLSGCNLFHEEVVPDSFSPYVEKFKIIAADYGRDINKMGRVEIRFAPESEMYRGDGSGVARYGVTKHLDSGKKLILINKDRWDEKDEVWREYLIFHELGHAVLGKEHNNTYIDFYDEDAEKLEGYPVLCDRRYLSVMAEGMAQWTVGCGIYTMYYEEYMEELFR